MNIMNQELNILKIAMLRACNQLGIDVALTVAIAAAVEYSDECILDAMEDDDFDIMRNVIGNDDLAVWIHEAMREAGLTQV